MNKTRSSVNKVKSRMVSAAERAGEESQEERQDGEVRLGAVIRGGGAKEAIREKGRGHR